MSETVFVRTCSLADYNLLTLAEDIRKWIPNSSVYVQNEPCRIVVCYSNIATVINVGDVFSFVQRFKGVYKNEVINHSEKRETVRVTIDSWDFLIEVFVYKTVGATENMRYRLTCCNDPDLSGEFDDYSSLFNRLSEFMWEGVSELI